MVTSSAAVSGSLQASFEVFAEARTGTQPFVFSPGWHSLPAVKYLVALDCVAGNFARFLDTVGGALQSNSLARKMLHNRYYHSDHPGLPCFRRPCTR